MNKILIVEDDQMLVEIYQKKFETEGFDVETARNGSEAIKKIQGSETKELIGMRGIESAKFYKGKGCERCNGEGYKGRLGIYETLEMSSAIQKMVSDNSTADEIEKKSKEEGMLTMLEDGIIKSLRGITTIDEILRVTKE